MNNNMDTEWQNLNSYKIVIVDLNLQMYKDIHYLCLLLLFKISMRVLIIIIIKFDFVITS